MRVEIVNPPSTLVLFGSPADHASEKSWGVSTWQFIVNSGPDGGCRLLTRGRYDHSPDWKSRLAFGRFPIEVITFVMSRKMMLEIKRLAEYRAQPRHPKRRFRLLPGGVGRRTTHRLGPVRRG